MGPQLALRGGGHSHVAPSHSLASSGAAADAPAPPEGPAAPEVPAAPEAASSDVPAPPEAPAPPGTLLPPAASSLGDAAPLQANTGSAGAPSTASASHRVRPPNTSRCGRGIALLSPMPDISAQHDTNHRREWSEDAA